MSILPPLLAMNTACWKYADIEGEWEVVLLGFWNVCICGGDSQHYNFVLYTVSDDVFIITTCIVGESAVLHH